MRCYFVDFETSKEMADATLLLAGLADLLQGRLVEGGRKSHQKRERKGSMLLSLGLFLFFVFYVFFCGFW